MKFVVAWLFIGQFLTGAMYGYALSRDTFGEVPLISDRKDLLTVGLSLTVIPGMVLGFLVACKLYDAVSYLKKASK